MKQIVMILLMALWTISGFSQGGKLSEEKKMEFEAQRVAFFTNYLALTPNEAAVFWPLYNEMQKKMRDRDRQWFEKMKEYNKSAVKKEETAKALIADKLTVEQDKLKMKKEYYTRLLSIIPASKVLKIDPAEHTFNKQLLNKMRGTPDKSGQRK